MSGYARKNCVLELVPPRPGSHNSHYGPKGGVKITLCIASCLREISEGHGPELRFYIDCDWGGQTRIRSGESGSRAGVLYQTGSFV